MEEISGEEKGRGKATFVLSSLPYPSGRIGFEIGGGGGGGGGGTGLGEVSLVRQRVTEIVAAWEGQSQDVELFRNVNLEDSKEISHAVAEVQKLLREWERLRKVVDRAADDEAMSKEELTAFQNLLLSWEKYRLLDHDRLIPKSYVRGDVGRDLEGEEAPDESDGDGVIRQENEDLDALTVAREVTKKLRKVGANSFLMYGKLDCAGAGGRIEGVDTIGTFLPDDLDVADPDQLDRLWMKLLAENPNRGFIASAEERQRAEAIDSEGEGIGSGERNSRTSSTRTVSTVTIGDLTGEQISSMTGTTSEEKSSWSSTALSSNSLSLFFLSKTTSVVHIRERLRLLLRPKRADERETRFLSLRNLAETRKVIEGILTEMKSQVVSKIGGRKIKCRVPIGVHTLHAVVFLEPMGDSTTKVTFLRSKDDQGRTLSKDFLSSYNTIALRFLEESG